MNRNTRVPDGGEILLLFLVLALVNVQVVTLLERSESLLVAHIAEQARLNKALPLEKRRPKFEDFVIRINRYGRNHFRKMFRMTLEVFQSLCSKISEAVGEDKFRPEKFLQARQLRITGSSEEPSTFISGEFKTAIALRMLAGGSYLDLCPLFDVHPSYIYCILDQFLDWVRSTFEFPLMNLLKTRNWEALYKLSEGFTNKTNGIFKYPFAALDGLAVRIRCPSDVPDPANYFCRKNFYSLNVQAMCDKSKYFLWCYPSNKGSTHDSAAFANSSLYTLLMDMARELRDKGLFILGDSAYWLSTFMMIPFEKPQMKSDPGYAKDSYNFYHSSCRINIECAFGELVMRWGIFWRSLQFDLKKCQKIIMVCMLLHNFILENREDDNADRAYFEDFTIPRNDIQIHLTASTGEIPLSLTIDNGAEAAGGRPSVDVAELKQQGEQIRTRLAIDLASNNLVRPMYNMYRNKYGNVIIK